MKKEQNLFTDVYVEAYEEVSGVTHAYEITAEILADRLEILLPNPQNITELGSGSGNSAAVLSKHFPNTQFFCIEPSPFIFTAQKKRCNKTSDFQSEEALRYVNEVQIRIQPTKDNIHLIRAVGEHIPLVKERIDAVICCESFHWLAPESALPEIYQILKPGGYLVLDESGSQFDFENNLNECHVTRHPLFQEFQRQLAGMFKETLRPHTYLFNQKSITELLQKYGFRLIPDKNGDPYTTTTVLYTDTQVESVIKNGARMRIAITHPECIDNGTADGLINTAWERTQKTEIAQNTPCFPQTYETFAGFVFQKK